MDEESLTLLGDFLEESREGLDEADRLLMGGADASSPDRVHGLFRIFHTIKGLAGFLDLEAVSGLAHATESLLGEFRERGRGLDEAASELVLDATGTMRVLLDEVERSAGGREELRLPDEFASVMERLATLGSVPAPTPRSSDGAPASMPTGPCSGRDAPQAGSGAGGTSQAPQPAGAGSVAPHRIKVDLGRVDRLLETIGELVIVESMVSSAPELAEVRSGRLRKSLGQLAKITRDLQDMAMGLRMVPVGGLFQKMARLVRDLARRSGKEVELVTEGEGTELDRSIVEALADPLVHLIRNAVDHGIEGREERANVGKPPCGRIRLSARQQGGSIVIEVADDGRGLDADRIFAKAVERGLVRRESRPPDAEVFALIFAPGFSTAREVTEISGRGVGMDVVRQNVEGLRGRIAIESEPRRGTTFRLVLPLTLAIIDGTLLRCGDETTIVPTLSIVESFRPRPSVLSSFSGSDLIRHRDEVLPLLNLGALLGLPDGEAVTEPSLVVVVETMGRRLALRVDEVVGQQQVVIKGLGDLAREVPFVAGGAILSDGRVGLILEVDELERLALPDPCTSRGAWPGVARV